MYSRNKPGKFDIWTFWVFSFFFHLFQLTKQTHYIHSSFLSNSCVFLEWFSTHVADVAVAMSFFDSENDLSRLNIKVLIYPFVCVRSDLLPWGSLTSQGELVHFCVVMAVFGFKAGHRFMPVSGPSTNQRSCEEYLLYGASHLLGAAWLHAYSEAHSLSVWTKRTYLHA